MADSLQRLGLNHLNHKLKVRRGGIEVTNGNISGSSTSTGSFGKLEVAGNSTLTGDLTLGGNITIGDADSDSITINADLTSNLIPNADSTYDIGSTSKNWKSGHIEEISATNVTASSNISASGIVYSEHLYSSDDAEIVDSLTIGGTISNVSTTHVTASGTITGSSVYGTTIGQNRTDGLKTITIEANSIINQDVSTDADATLGTLGVGNVTSTGIVSGSSVYGTTIGQNRTDGLKTITIEANSIINQDVSTDADATLGTLGVGNVTSTGTITGSAVYGTTIGQNTATGVKTLSIEANSTINQDVSTDAAVTFATIDTGQGANELYDMNQNVLTTSSPTFAGVNLTGDSNITGSLIITGDLTAQQYIVSSSVTYLTQSFASGSNIFGDSMDDTHVFSGSLDITGSNYISGTLNVQAEGVYSSSTAIYTNNITNGYPTSNPWGTSLGGSYFNNFDNTTNVSEILRFMSGVLSHSLDVADASPNTKTWASLTTTENSLGTTDSCDGYLPQSYDDSNATLKYLVTKNWVGTGTKIFSGITVYHDNGPSYSVDFDTVAGGTTTISSSADAQLFGLGGLTSGAATRFDVRVVATQSFSDTGSVSAPTTASATFYTQSQFDVSLTSFGSSNGVELAKINTAQPAVIPAAYQDGKFENLGGTDMTGSLTRLYKTGAQDFSSVSASGYYRFHDLVVGISSGSGNYAFKDGTTKNNFWAPIDQIESDIGSNTRGITSVTQSYLTATSRSLSGVPYLIGATYHLSASVHGLFDPMYKDSSTIADDTIGSVGVGSVAATSGVDGLSTSGGTIQTANAVLSTSGSGATLRSTSTVPYRTDVYRHNAIYTLSGTTGENIDQTGTGDTTFTVGVRGRNRANSQSTLATYTFFYHSGSTLGQPASSGSLGVYQRAQGYDGGALAGTTETFTGEDFRIRLTNDVTGFNGLPWFTNFTSSQDHLGNYDLQVKPGYLVEPGGDYRYWYPEDYHSSATYKYYVRRFQISGTKTSMTVNLNNNTLVNWKASTNNKVACALLFKSAGSGSGGNSELSTARIYDPSETTENVISSSVANDNFLNPFSSAIDLYGNTGGSVGSGTYTVPMRNSDGMYLDNTDNELYVIVRYTGDPAPIDDITLTFS
jgi:hypothetical protein